MVVTPDGCTGHDLDTRKVEQDLEGAAEALAHLLRVCVRSCIHRTQVFRGAQFPNFLLTTFVIGAIKLSTQSAHGAQSRALRLKGGASGGCSNGIQLSKNFPKIHIEATNCLCDSKTMWQYSDLGYLFIKKDLRSRQNNATGHPAAIMPLMVKVGSLVWDDSFLHTLSERLFLRSLVHGGHPVRNWRRITLI